jgi:SAM-dependent methyltransferase
MRATGWLKQIPLAQKAYRRARGAWNFLRRSLKFARDLAVYRRESRRSPFAFAWRELYPCLGDDTVTTGFDRHYTFHTAWAARLLAQTRPGVHHDISSAVYFSTLVSAFIPVRFYDYRPARLPLSNLTSEHADLLALPFPSGSIESLSCMHVVEHVGLGRYGDPIDPEGAFKAIVELKRVVRPRGNLLFVVPVGRKARVQFNAHRVFSLPMIKEAFSDSFTLRQYALIPDDSEDGDLVLSPSDELTAKQSYGCGCFWFEKKA